MGLFYSNFTLRGPSPAEVAAKLAGRSALVSPEHEGCVVVYDEATEEQDFALIDDLGTTLSQQFGCPVLAAVLHDDDVLYLSFYRGGEVLDFYDSLPEYFDSAAEESGPPQGGDAELLCEAFGATDFAETERILRRPTFAEDDPEFAESFEAEERHRQLVRALRLPPWSAGFGFHRIRDHETPEGLTREQFIDVGR